MSFTLWDFQGSISYTAQTRLEDYEHPRCRLITGLAVGKSLKILDSPIAKATQRRSSLTFYRWDLQVNLKRPLETIFEIVAVLSRPFFGPCHPYYNTSVLLTVP